jgi:hypothetical protein
VTVPFGVAASRHSRVVTLFVIEQPSVISKRSPQGEARNLEEDSWLRNRISHIRLNVEGMWPVARETRT